MVFKYGLLADYAGEAASHKAMIIGIFDVVYDVLGQRPIPIPQCYLVASFDAHVTEGSVHRLEIRFTNADGSDVIPPLRMDEFRFQSSGPGRPLRGNLIAAMNGLRVPELGDYSFHLLMDGHHMGMVPLYVVPQRPQGPPQLPQP